MLKYLSSIVVRVFENIPSHFKFRLLLVSLAFYFSSGGRSLHYDIPPQLNITTDNKYRMIRPEISRAVHQAHKMVGEDQLGQRTEV